MAPPLIFLSAGDPSGDIASARLVEQIKSKIGEVEFVGLGGERLRELGQEQLAEPLELAVLGFWEVAKRFFFFRRLMRRCVELIATRHPAVVVLVDYPGFNLRLAERIKPLGISIVYYISPQVGAWKKQRLDQIDRLVDTMLLILPFETKLYRDQGTNHEFVGHYQLEDIPAAYLNDLEGSSTQFETAVNGILDELWDDADATAGNLMITGVSIDDGPVRNDYADIPEQGDSHAMLCTVQFGPDV